MHSQYMLLSAHTNEIARGILLLIRRRVSSSNPNFHEIIHAMLRNEQMKTIIQEASQMPRLFRFCGDKRGEDDKEAKRCESNAC